MRIDPNTLSQLFPHGVAKTADLITLGLPSEKVLGRWPELLPGVVLLTRKPPNRPQRMQAALRYAGANAVVTGVDALHLHGIRSAPPTAGPVHVLTTRMPPPTRDLKVSTTRDVSPVLLQGFRTAPLHRAMADATHGIRTIQDLVTVLSEILRLHPNIGPRLRASFRGASPESRYVLAAMIFRHRNSFTRSQDGGRAKPDTALSPGGPDRPSDADLCAGPTHHGSTAPHSTEVTGATGRRSTDGTHRSVPESPSPDGQESGRDTPRRIRMVISRRAAPSGRRRFSSTAHRPAVMTFRHPDGKTVHRSADAPRQATLAKRTMTSVDTTTTEQLDAQTRRPGTARRRRRRSSTRRRDAAASRQPSSASTDQQTGHKATRKGLFRGGHQSTDASRRMATDSSYPMPPPSSPLARYWQGLYLFRAVTNAAERRTHRTRRRRASHPTTIPPAAAA
ncbi:hypothetical protein GCM10022243_03390 [Saccharothrix violaceirubra]|uniref:Uncharacterized protein n=1 Tax=Saccharothrix violaceirubra TaxID=413306 RepID=A0A7W7T001_9PSEU|nr:hypothetical protein [Saccharothrix violaceirubra]MBB4964087.1 hypothetical protein [Saccharothrix violaceirubra]